MQYMQRVLAKKYYQDKSQMRLVALIRDQLQEKVGYVQVTLTTGGAPGRFAVVDRIGITPNLEEYWFESQYVVHS